MTKFAVTRRVPYKVEQIYTIAGDVEAYKEFVPLVKRSTIRNRKDLGGGREEFDCELMITYKKLGISETFVSHVTVDPVEKVVKAHSNEGPVKSLDCEWRILEAAEGGTEIQFAVDYTLKSRSMQFLLSGMFDFMVRKLMTAFEQRAEKLYGSRAA